MALRKTGHLNSCFLEQLSYLEIFSHLVSSLLGTSYFGVLVQDIVHVTHVQTVCYISSVYPWALCKVLGRILKDETKLGFRFYKCFSLDTRFAVLQGCRGLKGSGSSQWLQFLPVYKYNIKVQNTPAEQGVSCVSPSPSVSVSLCIYVFKMGIWDWNVLSVLPLPFFPPFCEAFLLLLILLFVSCKARWSSLLLVTF